MTPNRLCGHPDSDVDRDGELVYLSYAHDLGATDQENGRRGAAQAERASKGASDAKLVPASSGHDGGWIVFFSSRFRQSGWQPFWAEVGPVRAQGGYTRGTGTNTGPHIKGPRCLINLPGKL
jgi:hypothetical protein